MNTLSMAQHWIDQGIAVIPISYRDKRPCFSALKQAGSVRNDVPTWDTYKNRLPTKKELYLWFAGAKRNLAVVTGWQGLTIIDFDNLNAYGLWLQWATTSAPDPLAAIVAMHTYRVLTARGVHLYIRSQEPVGAFQCGVIDVKASGGYCLTAPSVHPSGATYQVLAPDAPIMQVPNLEAVFPFAPTPTAAGLGREIISDPWESASRATHDIEHGTVAKILQSVRIEDILGIARSNGKVKVLCPLHADKNPSMMVDIRQQKCICYAGCTNGHPIDAIELYALLHGLTNRQAIDELSRRIA